MTKKKGSVPARARASEPQARVDEMLEVLRACRERGVLLTKDILVEAARDRRRYPALYGYLWDVSEAELAREARDQRAYKLIICHVTVAAPATPPTRVVIHITEDGGNAGYVHRDEVARNVDLCDQYLDKLRDNMRRSIRQYQASAAFLDPDMREPLGEAMRQAWRATFRPGRQQEPYPGDEEVRAAS